MQKPASSQAETYDSFEDLGLLYDHVRSREQAGRSPASSSREHLVARAGFTLDAIYGNFDRTPLTDASPEMIVSTRTGSW